MKRQVVYEGNEIVYEVVRKKVKNINFHVQSDLSVWVSAPKHISGQDLDQLVLLKAPWILQALAEMKERIGSQLVNCYDPACGRIAFLGQYLPLVVQQEGAFGWQLTEQGLMISGACHEEDVRQAVERFYQMMRIVVFEEINERIYQSYFAKKHLPKAQVKASRLSASWGRCHVQKGLIVLNGQLIKASVDCITSVLVHEYVHFLYPNHGAGFYNLLRQLLPQYDELNQQLKRQVSCRPED